MTHEKTTEQDMGVSDALRSERGPEWCAIFDTLREFTLSNMVFDGTEDAFCLVDAVSNAGGDISSGEEQLLILSDEISIALARTAKPAPEWQGMERMEAAARAICAVKGINPDAAHYGTSDRDVADGAFPDGRPFYFGWRNQIKYAEAVAAALLPSAPIQDTAK